MLICHNCGTPIENRAKQCHHCHSLVFSQASASLDDSILVQPLRIELETQPSVLNRLVTRDHIQATSNGHSHRSTVSATIEKDKPEENYFLSLPSNENPTPQSASPVMVAGNQEPSPHAIVTEPDFFAQMPNITQEDESIRTTEPFNLRTADFPIEQNVQQESKKTDNPFNIAESKENTASNWFGSLETNSNGADTKTPDKADNPLPKDAQTIPAENIHRRDFSGISINKSTEIVPKSLNFGTDANAIVSQLKSRFFSGIANNAQSIKTGKNKLLDPKASWTIYLSAIVLIFLLFKGFEAFCAISNSICNNLSLPMAQNSHISGRWQYAQKWNNTGCQGQMVLHENGGQIFGQGIDSQYGTYKFNGTRSENHLDLLKQYYVGNSFVGHPMEMHGEIDTASKPLFASGNFTLSYMQGGKWRGKPVVITGIWEAEMIQPLIEDNSSFADMPMIQKRDERPTAAYGGFFGSLAKNGTWIAGGIIAGGAFLYYMARALISPDGLLGIWDKQKYVPAQFMREHKKEKAQLSKPIVAGSLPLGQRWEWKFWQAPFFWIPRYLAIPPEIRVNSPHVLILGGGEKGKSRLMARMITHDIESADRAIVLVDSDGDLADLLIHWISAHPQGEEFAKRTIIIDPTGNKSSPSFNPLELPDDHDLQNAASSIVNGFKAIYHEPPGSQNQWSPQTAHILRNSAMLLMANGKTLLDLPTLLQDNDFRDILLEKIEQRRKEKVEYSTLLETWGQYKRLARTEQWINWYEPILNRVGPTLINQRLRPILTQPKGDINLKQIIAEKKILIVKIPKGQLHEDANLLGSLIVTGMKQAAISLCTENKIADRTAVMYLDEFDHFIEKETLDAITTETKKFQLGFIGATKTLQHLPEDWRNQIEANIGTMCVFALTKKDGDMLGPRMFRVSGRKAKHRTLMNIFNPINTSPQFELISDEEKYNIDRVLAQSERQFYAYRVGAEAGIFRMHSLDFDDIPDNQVNASLVELMYNNR